MAFLKRKQNYLGIDIGTSSMKVVELANEGGRPRLVTYGYVEDSADITKSDAPQVQACAASLVKQILQQSGATSTKVVGALPSFAVFTSIISLPSMSEKDLLAAVRWEAKKFVPMPLEEMILDWRILRDGDEKKEAKPKPGSKVAPTVGRTDEKKRKDLKILLTAAPKTLVKRYVDVFKTSELELMSLETESFALERALIGNDPAPIMIIDIGANATNISIVAKGIPILNRSIDVGGSTITKAIMNSMSIDEARAEQFKRDFGIAAGTGNEQIPKNIEFVIGSIINESRYVMNLYQGQGERPLEKAVLAGGSAFLPQLPEYLSRVLTMKVFIGDPWQRVIYPTDLKSTLDEIGPRFAVAIGLAMRNIV